MFSKQEVLNLCLVVFVCFSYVTSTETTNISESLEGDGEIDNGLGDASDNVHVGSSENVVGGEVDNGIGDVND